VQLSPGELGQRAQIFPGSIPLGGVFEDEITEFDNRERLEKEAVERIEKKRAEEKATGRSEIGGIMEQPNEETIHELGDLPVCTRTPRMFITGKIVIHQSLTLCTNNSKYLHQQRSAMN
jgi:hypothetical protein